MCAVLRMLDRPPGRRVAPQRVDAALRRVIGVEIGRHHEAVVVTERVDDRRVAARLVRREGAGGERGDRLGSAPARPAIVAGGIDAAAAALAHLLGRAARR